MLWEVEIRPRSQEDDAAGLELAAILEKKSTASPGVIRSSRVFLISGLDEPGIRKVADRLLAEDVVEAVEIHKPETPLGQNTLTILPKPGVMDPAAASVEFSISQLGTLGSQAVAASDSGLKAAQQTSSRHSSCWPTMRSSKASSGRCLKRSGRRGEPVIRSIVRALHFRP